MTAFCFRKCFYHYIYYISFFLFIAIIHYPLYIYRFLSDNNIRFPNTLLKEIVWPQSSDENSRRLLLGDVEAFMRDVKAYFAWQEQIASTTAVEASRLVIVEDGKISFSQSEHVIVAPPSTGMESSSHGVGVAVGKAGIAVGAIGSNRVPPLTIHSPSYYSSSPLSPAALFSDRTSTEGGSSLNQSPRAFPEYSPSPRFGSGGWSDPWAVGPSRSVSSRDEFQSIIGASGRLDDRTRMQLQTPRPNHSSDDGASESFSFFGSYSADSFRRPGELPLSTLSQQQHVPYSPRSNHYYPPNQPPPPPPPGPPPPRARASIGPSGYTNSNSSEFRPLTLPSQPPPLPVSSRSSFFPSMSVLANEMPLLPSTSISGLGSADSRMSYIGAERPHTESRSYVPTPHLTAALPLSESASMRECPGTQSSDAAAGNFSSFLPGLRDNHNIWRMQSDDEHKKPSFWSLF